jgi:hypothetical protein
LKTDGVQQNRAMSGKAQPFSQDGKRHVEISKVGGKYREDVGG